MRWMMPMLLEVLMRSVSTKSSSVRYSAYRIVGCSLLVVAAGMGLYFLYEILIPSIGYLESGAVISGILAITGIVFIALSMSEKLNPKSSHNALEEMLSNAGSSIKSIESEVKESITEKPLRFVLISLIAGLVVSQIGIGDKLSSLVKDVKNSLND